MTDLRRPSTTALRVAALRAVHQLFDAEPRVLDDPVIPRLLGDDAIQNIRGHLEDYQAPLARALRAHVVLRSRYAEDRLHDAVARGIQQYLVLGAGLDTFAYRQPAWASALRVIEIDHPASQAGKSARLAEAGIAPPANVTYAGIDFEREAFADGLQRCGVALDRPTFASWLGVTMYLSRDVVGAVLAAFARFPRGSELVVTFAQPDPAHPLARAAAEVGEPWLSTFTPDDMTAALRDAGFASVELLARDEAVRRYFTERRDGLLAPRRISIATAIV